MKTKKDFTPNLNIVTTNVINLCKEEKNVIPVLEKLLSIGGITVFHYYTFTFFRSFDSV